MKLITKVRFYFDPKMQTKFCMNHWKSRGNYKAGYGIILKKQNKINLTDNIFICNKKKLELDSGCSENNLTF